MARAPERHRVRLAACKIAKVGRRWVRGSASFVIDETVKLQAPFRLACGVEQPSVVSFCAGSERARKRPWIECPKCQRQLADPMAELLRGAIERAAFKAGHDTSVPMQVQLLTARAGKLKNNTVVGDAPARIVYDRQSWRCSVHGTVRRRTIAAVPAWLQLQEAV
jgi:hypothetical protein